MSSEHVMLNACTVRTQYIRKTKVVLSDLDLIQALLCVSFRSYVSDLDLIQALMCVSFRICVSGSNGSLVDIHIYIHRG